jgi:hypothetical protein
LAQALLPAPRIGRGEPFSVLIPFGAFRDVDTGTVLRYEIAVTELATNISTPLDRLEWATFDADRHRLNGLAVARGRFRVDVTALDPSNASASGNFSLVVNTAPELRNPPAPARAIVGVPFTLVLPADTFDDADGDSIVMELRQENNLPLHAWFSWRYDAASATVVITGVALRVDVGTLRFRVYGSDPLGASAGFAVVTIVTVGMCCEMHAGGGSCAVSRSRR